MPELLVRHVGIGGTPSQASTPEAHCSLIVVPSGLGVGGGDSEHPPGLGDRCGAPVGNPVSGELRETKEALGYKMEDWCGR